jgi:hypothetical protein
MSREAPFYVLAVLLGLLLLLSCLHCGDANGPPCDH